MNTYAQARCSLYTEIMWLYMKELLRLHLRPTVDHSAPTSSFPIIEHPSPYLLPCRTPSPSGPTCLQLQRCPHHSFHNIFGVYKRMDYIIRVQVDKTLLLRK
jgi:hypothetical protein